MNARSQRRYLRPQGLQFILWIGHAGKLSHLTSQRKGFVAGVHEQAVSFWPLALSYELEVIG